MLGPVAALHHAATALGSDARLTGAAFARAAQQAPVDHTSVWLLLAAALIGFAAAWLVFEVRRAWSPESLRAEERAPVARHDADALNLVVPKLVDQVTQLRLEIAELRAGESRRTATRFDRRAETSDPHAWPSEADLAQFSAARAEQRAWDPGPQRRPPQR